MEPITTSWKTDPGLVRDHNEDAATTLTLPSGEHVLLVCDGMGGHSCGEVASALAMKVITAALSEASTASTEDRLRDALVRANRAVVEKGRAEGAGMMGSTAAIAVVSPDGRQCWAAWVGDSRVAIYRDGREFHRSRDHSQVAMMVERGIITERQARKHSDSGVLLRALGGGAEAQKNFEPELWPEPQPLRRSDVVVVSSDGLHGTSSTEDIANALAGRKVDDAAQALIALANRNGGKDNIAVALLNIGPPAPPAVRLELPADAKVPVAPSPRAAPSSAPPPASASKPRALVGAVAALVVAIVVPVLWWATSRPEPPTPTPAPPSHAGNANAAAVDTQDAGVTATGPAQPEAKRKPRKIRRRRPRKGQAKASGGTRTSSKALENLIRNALPDSIGRQDDDTSDPPPSDPPSAPGAPRAPAPRQDSPTSPDAGPGIQI